MQTFMPYTCFYDSAHALDNKRLGKQRVEGLQILMCLLGAGCAGWSRHPAVKMWTGHEARLAKYTMTMCDVWRSKGYNDTVKEKVTLLTYSKGLEPSSCTIAPTHLACYDFTRSHRSALLRKDYNFYSRHGWSVPTDLPYIWPRSEHVRSH